MHVKLTSLTNVLASGNGIQYFTLFLLEIHVVYIEFHELFQIDTDGYLQIAQLISTKFYILLFKDNVARILLNNYWYGYRNIGIRHGWPRIINLQCIISNGEIALEHERGENL